ncbi:hypothetical protein BKM31_14870 [[Actinomadura] parvosata subsp. kistnae]|uniref:Uncharacterized protein n=1 Tax=[Actinomadura] parvosata subsp. kistnae TaxID=1909395 RepID=A0A1U9ZXA0_9ACTN|nr:polyprenyl synthetase family protein [Nonomuraea sp. ATCC 55076]AQZ62570.1 hypothetical protein BKM31_14870 [Nonomuraea sp. ATCC 55076]
MTAQAVLLVLEAGTALLTLAVRMLATSRYHRRDQMITALMDSVVGNSEGRLADLALDHTTGRPADPATCLRAAEAKTGPTIRAACRLGALADAAAPGQVDDITELGTPIALVMQLRNDLDDLWAPLTGDTPHAAPILACGSGTAVARCTCSRAPSVETTWARRNPGSRSSMLSERISSARAAVSWRSRHSTRSRREWPTRQPARDGRRHRLAGHFSCHLDDDFS